MMLANDVQARESERSELASLMADYEAKHGPVETTGPVKPNDSASWYGTASVQRANKVTRNKAADRRAALLPVVRRLAGEGMGISQISKEAGISTPLIRRIADEAGIHIEGSKGR